MVKSALPSGSGTAANSNSRPSISDTRPVLCLRSTVALRTSSRTSPAWLARFSFGGEQGRQRVDPGMAGELLLLEAPQLLEAVVPQIEPAVRGEHADRLEQIVEGRGAHPQQGVARRGELDLLGPVLEDGEQAAVGQRLGDDAQMLAAGKQPILLLGREARGEPEPMLLLPVREVAHLGQVAGLAHRVDHPVELGPVGEEVGGQRE